MVVVIVSVAACELVRGDARKRGETRAVGAEVHGRVVAGVPIGGEFDDAACGRFEDGLKDFFFASAWHVVW